MRWIMVVLLLVACSDKSTGPIQEEVLQDFLSGNTYTRTVEYAVDYVETYYWSFYEGSYVYQMLVNNVLYRQWSGVYSLFEVVTEDPPGFGMRYTQTGFQQWSRDTGEKEYVGTRQYPNMARVLVAAEAVRIGDTIYQRVSDN